MKRNETAEIGQYDEYKWKLMCIWIQNVNMIKKIWRKYNGW